MIDALNAMIDVLKIPFVKLKSSDELYQVPNVPLILNSLCRLLKLEIQFGGEDGITLEEQE
jgi:hypothetical protein